MITFDIFNDILESDESLKRSSFRERDRNRDDENRDRENDNTVIELSAIENALVSFENMIILTTASNNLLYFSVSYDFECFNHLIWDKSQFLDNITFAYEWISTFDEDLFVKDFDTMLIHETLKEKQQFLHFRHTAYVLDSLMTLISISKLKKKEFLWNMHTNTIEKKRTLIFELKEHFDFYTIEYRLVDHVDAFANFVDFRVSTVFNEIL